MAMDAFAWYTTGKGGDRYTPEFRAKGVRVVTGHGLSQRGAARGLAIFTGTLADWITRGTFCGGSDSRECPVGHGAGP
jgi:transposase